MKFFVFCFFSLFLFSCGYIKNLQDYSLTHIASQIVSYNLAEEDREDLLALFRDIRSASKCSQIEYYMENLRTLVLFEREFRLRKGFAFDVFLKYDFDGIFDFGGSDEERIAFLIFNVWKTKYSSEEIHEIIVKIRRCYPYR